MGGSALFVDLDGTLLATDTVWECLVASVRKNPWLCFCLPFWLIRGRAYLKGRLAAIAMPEFATLPVRDDVMAYVREQRQSGRHVVLATASHRDIALQIAEQFGIFDDVLASDSAVNLRASAKLSAIEEYCRKHGFDRFDYIGDSRADLAVWPGAHRAIVAAPGGRIERLARGRFRNVEVLGTAQPEWAAWVKALRPHHWSKNLLVLASVVFGHQIFVWQSLIASLGAFVAFCGVSSAVYLLNDVLDVASDRQHPAKKKRPFAAGDLMISHGIAAGGALIVATLALSILFLPISFAGVLVLYLLANALYSLWLKQKVLVDVLLLAGFFTLRVIAGGAATGIGVSEWLLAFSTFLFLSLAFLKRFSELLQAQNSGVEPATGRGYQACDLEIVRVLGPATGCLAVLVLSLYINSPQVKLLYKHPNVLWLVCPLLLFWITRIWIWANRGMNIDDPVTFSLRDRTTWLTAAVVAVLAGIASY